MGFQYFIRPTSPPHSCVRARPISGAIFQVRDRVCVPYAESVPRKSPRRIRKYDMRYRPANIFKVCVCVCVFAPKWAPHARHLWSRVADCPIYLPMIASPCCEFFHRGVWRIRATWPRRALLVIASKRE